MTNIYKNKLVRNILIKSSDHNLMPLSVINGEENQEIFKTYLIEIANQKKPLYKSRQELLKYIYVDHNNYITFHTENGGEGSTLAGSSSHLDPFYDSNQKSTDYYSNGILISRERYNLKSSFFVGEHKPKSKENLIKVLSLENRTIEQFEKLFTPYLENGSLDSYLKYFLNNVNDFFDDIILENYDIKPAFIADDIMDKIKIKKIVHQFSKLYLDENDGIINIEPIHISRDKNLEIGEILTFDDDDQRIVIELKEETDPVLHEQYLKIKLKKI